MIDTLARFARPVIHRRAAHPANETFGRLTLSTEASLRNEAGSVADRRRTMLDFALLPPEGNSARMYTGPGAGPLLAAAAAWSGLAAELESAATGYQTAVADLAGDWLGPSAATIGVSAAPYVAWLSATAAAAYEAAFAMTVPPSIIAANRSLLTLLVATNVLGQNTAAIAATEAHYAQMWAQDATAMYGYAAGSAGATRLTPFTGPKRTTNPNGLSGRSQTALSQLLQGLAQPAQFVGSTAPGTGLSGVTATSGNGVARSTGLLSGMTSGPGSAVGGLAMDTLGLGMDTVGLAGMETPGLGTELMGLGIEFYGLSLEQLGADVMAGPLGVAAGGLSPLGALGSRGGLGSLGGVGAATTAATATMGEAASLGSLSVPASWSSAAPAIRQEALLSSETGAAAAAASASEMPFAEMALSSMAGRAMAGSVGRGRGEQSGSAGRRSAGLPAMSAAAELRELTELLRELVALREAGVLTEDEFLRQKERLLSA